METQVRGADGKKSGAKADPCGTPFLKHCNLLHLLLPMLRVKLRLPTSSMIMRTIYACQVAIAVVTRLGHDAQVAIAVVTRLGHDALVSQAAVRSTNTAPAF